MVNPRKKREESGKEMTSKDGMKKVMMGVDTTAISHLLPDPRPGSCQWEGQMYLW